MVEELKQIHVIPSQLGMTRIDSASLRNEPRYRDLVSEVTAQRDGYRDLYERLRPMIWSQ
jgi:hypothetical protein